MKNQTLLVETLKQKSNELLKCNNSLTIISKKIFLPSNKTIMKYIFWTLFTLIYILILSRYLFNPQSSKYSFLALIFGLTLISAFFSFLLGGILYLPTYFFIKYRRNRIFFKSKSEIDSLLNNIRFLILDFSSVQIPQNYLNEFYLEEIGKYLKETPDDLAIAITKFENETLNNKKFKYKKNIALARYDIMLNLSNLVNIPTVTDSIKNWKEAYFTGDLITKRSESPVNKFQND